MSLRTQKPKVLALRKTHYLLHYPGHVILVPLSPCFLNKKIRKMSTIFTESLSSSYILWIFMSFLDAGQRFSITCWLFLWRKDSATSWTQHHRSYGRPTRSHPVTTFSAASVCSPQQGCQSCGARLPHRLLLNAVSQPGCKCLGSEVGLPPPAWVGSSDERPHLHRQ